ncbi:MAG: hypothetical protein IPM69_16180 [Ignavibacteria bacterium]|nr:hypothetical protein [Ignavibacteria bacterium]
MMTLTQEQVHDIAQELDCGFRCFLHSETGELLSIPVEAFNGTMDTEFFEEDLEKLEENFLEYREIPRMESHDSFRIMEEFAEELTDNKRLQNRLLDALGQRKPFRGFKDIIDDSGDYREMWFAFKNQKLEDWVRDHTQNFELNAPDME